MSASNGSWKGLRSSKHIAILGSSAASLMLGLAFLEPELEPPNFPAAVVVAALFFEPALLMILPPRRASLDLAAGIIAAFLALGFVLFPYALALPEFSIAGLFTAAGAVAAFIHNSLAPETRGDAKIATLAVVVMVCAVIAAGVGNHPMCRASAVESACVDDATSYVGAAASVATLWLGTTLVWLAARTPMPKSPATIMGG